MLELRLRHWLKDLLGEENLQWVEPSYGSSVGRGDAIIDLPRNGKLPVELKVWKKTRKGLKCDMRASQIRYHYMTWHRKEGNTAILFALENDIYVLAGKYVPRDKYNHFVEEKKVWLCDIDLVGPSYTKHDLFKSFVKAFNK